MRIPIIGSIAIVLVWIAAAQRVDHGTTGAAGSSQDFAAASVTRPNSVGATPPVSCVQGQTWWDSDDRRLLVCNSTGNGWDQITGAGGLQLQAAGDLHTRDATTDTRLPVGTDGQILRVDAAQPTLLRYTTARAVQERETQFVANNGATTNFLVSNPATAGWSAGSFLSSGYSFAYSECADATNCSLIWWTSVPDKWDASQAVELAVRFTRGSGSNTAVRMTAETACVADATNLSTLAFNPVQVPTYTFPGAEHMKSTFVWTNLDMTGCAAKRMLAVRLSRDGGHVNDTFTGPLRLISASLRFRSTLDLP